VRVVRVFHINRHTGNGRTDSGVGILLGRWVIRVVDGIRVEGTSDMSMPIDDEQAFIESYTNEFGDEWDERDDWREELAELDAIFLA
jgi:hypothetical protein